MLFKAIVHVLRFQSIRPTRSTEEAIFAEISAKLYSNKACTYMKAKIMEYLP